jgi:tRNA threonylcarbamoyladenosine biosynthesis protein TsaB
MMDAKRMDVFTAIFDQEGNEIVPPKAVTVEENFRQEIMCFEKIGIGGNCLEKCKTVFINDFVFIENTNCDSRSMVLIAEKKLLHKQIENTAYFEPFYLKEFEARLKKNI